MREEIRKLMRATPWVPFTLFVTDGRYSGVATSDHIFILPGLSCTMWLTISELANNLREKR